MRFQEIKPLDVGGTSTCVGSIILIMLSKYTILVRRVGLSEKSH